MSSTQHYIINPASYHQCCNMSSSLRDIIIAISSALHAASYQRCIMSPTMHCSINCITSMMYHINTASYHQCYIINTAQYHQCYIISSMLYHTTDASHLQGCITLSIQHYIISTASYHQCCIASPMLHQIINHAYHIIAASYHQQCILSTLYHIIIINAPVHYHHCIKSSTLHYNNSAALTF